MLDPDQRERMEEQAKRMRERQKREATVDVDVNIRGRPDYEPPRLVTGKTLEDGEYIVVHGKLYRRVE